MKIEAFIRVLAGSVILLGLALAVFVDRRWLLLPAIASVNLIQSSLTGFCPPTLLLAKLGWLDGDGLIHWGGRKR